MLGVKNESSCAHVADSTATNRVFPRQARGYARRAIRSPRTCRHVSRSINRPLRLAAWTRVSFNSELKGTMLRRRGGGERGDFMAID